MSGGIAQVAKHLPSSMRPWVLTPVLPKKRKRKTHKNVCTYGKWDYKIISIIQMIYRNHFKKVKTQDFWNKIVTEKLALHQRPVYLFYRLELMLGRGCPVRDCISSLLGSWMGPCDWAPANAKCFSTIWVNALFSSTMHWYFCKILKKIIRKKWHLRAGAVGHVVQSLCLNPSTAKKRHLKSHTNY
jgi:hypothetical protein